jgi:hypothetical protein
MHQTFDSDLVLPKSDCRLFCVPGHRIAVLRRYSNRQIKIGTMYIRGYAIAVAMCFLATSAGAQLARVFNASFEGEPRDATIPRGWHICEEGTTPDILPGPWGVYLEPADGETYVGLITRENGTWESIGQRITEKLEEGGCYHLSLELARSDTYMGYNNPIKLRIWGGDRKCRRTQLIGETERIEHTDWRRYSFNFSPDEDLRYLILEAFHVEGTFSYSGNILVDDISTVKPCGKS